MAQFSHNNAAAGSSESGADAVSLGRRPDAVRYARDNGFVRTVHAVTTGPFKPLFIAAVIAAVVIGLYFPLQDLYVAYRSQSILEEQIAIRTAYNEALEEEVEALLSEEGIQDLARKELGMVMEGETALNVTGLDEDGNAIVVESESDASSEDAADDAADDATDDAAEDASATADEDADADDGAADEETTSTPTTAAEVEAAEAAVYENSAWYWKVLDTIFCFDGTSGQAVVSTGE